MVDLTTRKFSPHSPDHYARRKVGVDYDAAATCPRFQRFLAGCFADRAEAVHLQFEEEVVVVEGVG